MIILLRHGETVWNKQKRVQGSKDSALTKKGEMQVKSIGIFLKENFDENFIIYSSSLERAVTSAKIISHILNTKSKSSFTSSYITEMSFGVFEGKTKEYICSSYADIQAERSLDKWNYDCFGFESYKKVYKRAEFFFKQNKKKLLTENVILVTHETFIKVFLSLVMGYKRDELFEIKHPNNLVRVIEGNTCKEFYVS